MGRILVVNAGSSSIKLAVFAADGALILAAQTSGIGGVSRLKLAGQDRPLPLPDHATALAALLEGLDGAGQPLAGLTAAAHRVVHGGSRLTAPCRVTPAVMDAIAACAPLAPLHNPHNLAAIRALAALAPDLPQFASFDTAFHATNPEVARRYAIPAAEDARGLRRYGFHGLSYAGMVAGWGRTTGTPLPDRLLALHLGNGASLCAIRAGRSVATTMGWSPLDGLTMGTRAGAIDGNAVLDLARRHGIEGAARMLNHDSGLLALGGHSDMAALLAGDTDGARFAVDHFIYWAVRHAGSMIAAMGGLDAMAFTGGIGENANAVRAGIVAGLGWAGAVLDAGANARGESRLHPVGGNVAIWTVAAEEERQIAAEALAVMAGAAEGRT